jgi:glycosidase
MLSLYKALLRLRRDNDVLSAGGFRLVSAGDTVLAYERQLGSRQVLIALNMTDRVQVLQTKRSAKKLLLSTCLVDPGPLNDDEVRLRANEGLVLGMLPDAL